ncbi:hypothetical protein [Sphingobium algorifonticola]|uniref:Uncharacterized protein n=1 Tax=Sphingobium algorifonticola TaxID=2008318 RepID=A0A437J4E0_9SPHN|nr:hypothetical protein [Sphingobium algorifonticola]RVT39427.1 hypothetical protein ENE74_15395 [Sphingobium algorifonticola]
MRVSRRGVLAGVAGGMATTGAVATNSAPGILSSLTGEEIDRVSSGNRWVRLARMADGGYALQFGSGNEPVCVLEKAVGVRWYRKDGQLPDGERRQAWTSARSIGSSGDLFELEAVIADARQGSWLARTTVRSEAEGFRLVTRFTRQGDPRAASVRMHVDFAIDPAGAFTMLPGSVYNGNKADRIFPRPYMPMPTYGEFKARPASFQKDRVTADIPRMDASTDWTVHLWGHQAASAEISIFDPVRKAGAHLAYPRTQGDAVIGVILTGDPAEGRYSATIENPCVRERRYRLCKWTASEDKPRLFAHGDQATVELMVSVVRTPDVPSFVTSWTAMRDLRRAGRAPGQTGPIPPMPLVVPRSHASAITLAYNSEALWDERGFYRTVDRQSTDPRELILGWASGTMELMAMYRLGSAKTRERVRRTMALILDEGQAPGGLFYGARMSGRWTGADENFDYIWAVNALTPRRTTDTVFGGLDLADTLRAGGSRDEKALADRLDAALRKACDALVRVWRKEGEIPFLLEPKSEKALWRGGFGGARAIGCLARAADRWRNPVYLAVAREIADRYIAAGLSRGETWGGPSDVLQGTTDQESLTAFTEGLVLLHRVTKAPAYRQAALHAADLLATWALNEHVVFPPDTLMGKKNLHLVGALNASTQNCWGTPGLCTNSGNFLLELYEATGEPRLMDLLSDISRVAMQMVVLRDKEWGELKPGQMTECASFNDVPTEFGEPYIGTGAHWPVNAMLLCQVELPSVYIDAERCWTLDHLDARLTSNGRALIGNPTPFPAQAKVAWRGGGTVTVALRPGESKDVARP